MLLVPIPVCEYLFNIDTTVMRCNNWKNESIKSNLFGVVRGDTVEEKVYLKVTPLETPKDDYAQNTSGH